MRNDVIVVGAGLAGLYVARKLARSGLGSIVLEAARRPGGRVRSMYVRGEGTDGSRAPGAILYETGAWRVPSTHRRAIRLFEETGVQLRPLRTPARPGKPQGSSMRGLSIWGSNAYWLDDPLRADRADLQTGYAGETQAAAGTSPYIADAPRYFCADEGFSEMVRRLEGECDVRYDHRVTDVRKSTAGGYVITCSAREKDGTLRAASFFADTIFVCVPPERCREWSIFAEHARPLMAAVKSAPLNHIYIAQDAPSRGSFHHTHSPTSLLGQTLSDQYGGQYLQASYSSGRLARFWYNLRLSHPALYLRKIKEQLFSLPFTRHASFGSDVRSYFWEHAFHMWIPTPGFDLARSVKLSVTPNAVRLPGVFCAGEAFSSHQAWMEGALETAELALAAFLSDPPPPRRLPRAPLEVAFDGRILDLTSWIDAHPGGREAIANHVGDEDLSHTFRHILHSDFAYAVVYAMQVGWAPPRGEVDASPPRRRHARGSESAVCPSRWMLLPLGGDAEQQDSRRPAQACRPNHDLIVFSS